MITEKRREDFKKGKVKFYKILGEDKNTFLKFKHISIRTALKVLKKTYSKDRGNRSIIFHNLKHSFSTNFLESGIDLRYIQGLLGYVHSKATEIYTHASTKNLSAIKNPFYNILKGGKA